MLRLGLTGGIGSGKSTVGKHLVSLGAVLVDADDIARQCTLAGGLAIHAITEQFGKGFLTPEGAMDRTRMREHVFSYPEARQQLEAIIHPLVQREMWCQANAATTRSVVFDIPLLVESAQWRFQLDRVLVVDCSVDTQIERVMRRNGWPREQVEMIVRQQCGRDRRLAAADWVLYNDDIALETLHSLVRRLAVRLGL